MVRRRASVVRRTAAVPRVRLLLRWITAGVAFAYIYLTAAYLTLPDVRPLTTSNPATSAFMDLGDREARSAGRTPRRVHRWVPYGRISPHLKNAVLVAEDSAFYQHEGIDLEQIREMQTAFRRKK